jgi:predicted nucleic-acid-binding protein
VIALDTNVLVQFFRQDHPSQCAQVNSIMNSLSEDEPGWVGLAAILELVWVLTSTYRVGRNEVHTILEHLLARREIVVEQAEIVRRAIEIYRNPRVSFADCVISASAVAAGCVQTLTFDQDAAKLAGMTLIT